MDIAKRSSPKPWKRKGNKLYKDLLFLMRKKSVSFFFYERQTVPRRLNASNPEYCVHHILSVKGSSLLTISKSLRLHPAFKGSSRGTSWNKKIFFPGTFCYDYHCMNCENEK